MSLSIAEGQERLPRTQRGKSPQLHELAECVLEIYLNPARAASESSQYRRYDEMAFLSESEFAVPRARLPALLLSAVASLKVGENRGAGKELAAKRAETAQYAGRTGVGIQRKDYRR